MNLPSQPFPVALPSPANFGIDGFCALVEASLTDGRSNIEPGTLLISKIPSAYGTGNLRVYLTSRQDFADAMGEPDLFFANSGVVYVDPSQCRDVVAAYRDYQGQPTDEAKAQALAGKLNEVLYMADPSDPKAVQLQFVAA